MAAFQPQYEFRYQRVELFRNESLGVGSYGVVCKAMCDDLPCAAKILHPTLFQFTTPGVTSPLLKFKQECHLMSAIKHPNIVQYLGTYHDPESKLPVLLMELMEESLSQFLERSHEPLPYHTEINLCHDIALALSYLHSNDIIHRDLSSNNVLLIAGSRAKVTDFGMVKLYDMNRKKTHLTPLTLCPGAVVYMSPEALGEPPMYTDKLDSFSLGVLSVQIMTRHFPNPTNRFQIMEINDPRAPSGRVWVQVPEIERRQAHIDLIDQAHPLLPVVFECLKDSDKERPSCHEFCGHMSAQKASPKYIESIQQSEVNTKSKQSANKGIERETQQSQQIHDLQQLLHTKKIQLHSQSHQLQAKKEELSILHLSKDEQLTAKDKQLQQKEAEIAACQQEIQQLRQLLKASDQPITQFQQDLLAKEKIIEEQKKQIQELQQQPRQRQEEMVASCGEAASGGYLRGVDVIEETSVLVTSQAQTVHWAGFGLKLHIPQGALPPGLEHCRILLKVGLSGQFEFPWNTSLVSAVYWLTSEPPCKFAQHLTVEIQHCVKPAHISKLTFVQAKCSQTHLPYVFNAVEGGVTSRESAYGCLKLNHFSLLGIVYSMLMPVQLYCASLYYLHVGTTQREIHFVITKNLEAHTTDVQRKYIAKGATSGPDLRVEFNSDSISLQRDTILEDGWRIFPLFHPMITKEEVDNFKPGRRIPSCQLKAEWTKRSQPSRLIYQMMLEGAKEPSNYFCIDLNSDSTPPGLHSKYPVGLDIEPKLSDLMEEIAAVIPTKWRDIGLQLGLDKSVLEGIALISPGDTNHCYSNVFTQWNNQNLTTHPYTWSTVVRALETRVVGENRVAQHIKTKLTGHPS